jgi:YidC/Oxa1 family membrane protein insertase
MDRKSIIVLSVSFILILLWPKLMNKMYPPKPRSTNEIVLATNQVISTSTPPSLTATTSAPPTQASAALLTKPGAPEETLVVTNDDVIYTFSSHGGGLKLLELRHYPAVIECGRDVAGEHRLASLNTRAPIPAFALVGNEALQGDGVYKLERTENGVRAEKLLSNGIHIAKDFEISTNYLLKTKFTIENRGAGPLMIPAQELSIGTATPLSAHDTGMDVGAFWYNGQEDEHVDQGYFANKTLGCFPGTPRSEYVAGNSNIVWAAVHNQFFTMATVMDSPAERFVTRSVTLPHFPESTNNSSKTQPIGYQAAVVLPATTLLPGSANETSFTVYAGPRQYNFLARLGEQMKNNLDLVMGFQTRFGGSFTGFFAKALLLSMNALHAIGLHYGLAIIGITVIIKLLFWPLTNASTKSMKRMQLLQPQMTALREKYKDDSQKMNLKLMEFMREHKINPLGGCLPIVVQIPIFIGFYSMLQSAIELRGVSFLWACDLSQPDTIAHLGAIAINPLPLLMGVTMFWQAQITPVSPGMDPAQQKIMKYMPLMFLFILYNMSAGLVLYWTVQNLLTIAQMKITKATDVTRTPTTPTTVLPPKKKKK